MDKLIEHYFSRYSSSFLTNLELMIKSMLRSGSCNTSELARAMNHETKEGFKANDMRIYRFLQNKSFQIDDQIWRCYFQILFDAMEERGLIQLGDQIPIKIDFTTSIDDFLILSASVDFNGRSVSLYFTMRNYPKRSGQMDQKKMEEAFARALKHLLSKKYTYVIVADRGFGNKRFSSLCRSCGFDYVLRMNDNLGLDVNGEKKNLEDYSGQDFDLTAKVRVWKEVHRFVGCTKGDDYWILLTSLPAKVDKIHDLYRGRFGIEKCFQDQKKSGFNIESTKIRKYDRFKRMYFCVCMAQVFTVIVGEFLQSKNHPIKKKYPVHTAVILASSGWEKKLLNSFLKPASASSSPYSPLN